MSENIDSALDEFLSAQPMVTLSHENKIQVLAQTKEGYEKHYNYLYSLGLEDRWGEYERRTYDTLVSALQAIYYRMLRNPP